MNLLGESSAFRVQGERVSLSFIELKEKKVPPPLESEGCSAERCFISVFLQLPVLQRWQHPVSMFGLCLPTSSLSSGCPPPRHCLLPRWLSGTQDPWEIHIRFSFHNCSLISRPHNGLTDLACSCSCCRYGEIKFWVQLREPVSDFCYILPLEKKLNLVLFSVL